MAASIPDLKAIGTCLQREDGWQAVNQMVSAIVQDWDPKLPLPQTTGSSLRSYKSIVGDLRKLDAEGELTRALDDFPDPEINKNCQIVPHVIALDYSNQATERYVTEMYTRFFLARTPKRGHLFLCFWQDDIISKSEIQQRAREAVFRYYFQLMFGTPRTLADMLKQEGLAQSYAGRELSGSEARLETAARIIQDHLDSEQYRHQFSCIFGDEIAALLDYKPLGLPAYAGVNVALAKAKEACVDPVTFHQTTFALSQVS